MSLDCSKELQISEPNFYFILALASGSGEKLEVPRFGFLLLVSGCEAGKADGDKLCLPSTPKRSIFAVCSLDVYPSCRMPACYIFPSYRDGICGSRVRKAVRTLSQYRSFGIHRRY